MQLNPLLSMHLRGARAARQHRALTFTFSLLFSLAAAGCGSDGALAPGFGSGSVTATGAVNASGSGLAVFQTVSSGGTSLFQIVVVPVTQSATTWQLQIANYSGRLAAGTYSLTGLYAGSPNPTATFYYTSGANIQTFNSTSGQLVITASSASEVSGTFTFTGTDPLATGTGTVTAHGSFTAQCAPGFTCL